MTQGPRFTSADVHGIRTLSASGEIDLASSDEFRTAVTAERDHRVLVISLLGVDYMDSTALGVLVGEHKRRTEQSEALLVVLPPPPCLRIFEVSRVMTILSCFEDLNAALARGREIEAASPDVSST